MGKFQTAFKGNLEFLTNKIQLDEVLWARLDDCGIMTKWQIETCRNREKFGTQMAQVSEMLNILQRRDDECFDPFCKILEELGQKEVARKLREKVPSAGGAQLLSQSTYMSTTGASSSTPRPIDNNGRCGRCGSRPPHDDSFPWMFQCFIAAKRVGLIENLNVDGNFYAYLQQEQILGNPAIARIKNKGDVYSQREELLTQLALCDDGKLERFLYVLECCNGEHIARLIRNYFS